MSSRQKNYIPLAIDEVTLSWAALNTDPSTGKSTVLITAVPNSILRGYQKVFQLAKLDLIALDIEAMSLFRSVIGEDMSNNLLIDIGAKSTHLNITEKGNLILSRNVPVGGRDHY